MKNITEFLLSTAFTIVVWGGCMILIFITAPIQKFIEWNSKNTTTSI